MLFATDDSIIFTVGRGQIIRRETSSGLAIWKLVQQDYCTEITSGFSVRLSDIYTYCSRTVTTELINVISRPLIGKHGTETTR